MKPDQKCRTCGECESDLEHCQDCGHLFCDDCGGWYCNPNDEDNGDWFCHDCGDGQS